MGKKVSKASRIVLAYITDTGEGKSIPCLLNRVIDQSNREVSQFLGRKISPLSSGFILDILSRAGRTIVFTVSTDYSIHFLG
jgi:hypothetical protein